MLRCTVLGLFIGMGSWLASPALAADGRVEINQAVVDAAGGFPFVISAPGSYVLTGDLVVTSDVGAIAINILGGVTIDLNGFHIQGSSTCVLGSCGQGAATGLSGPPFFGFGSNIAVHGGEISGFSGSCVALGSLARVERMHVAQCGRNGIFVGGGGSVTGNLVISTGENGILLAEGSVYSHNSVRLANLGGGGGIAIRGGIATAGNYCDDGSCSPTGQRSFYLTPGLHTGATAGTACTTGFHVAQLSEIWGSSGLHYDETRGLTVPGERGPPMSKQGWLYASDDDDLVDCSNFTSTQGNGRSAILFASSDLGPWRSFTIACFAERHVWCVED